MCRSIAATCAWAFSTGVEIMTTRSPCVRTGYWNRATRSRMDSPKGTRTLSGKFSVNWRP